MGDRANVRIDNGDEHVYLYAHSTGAELPRVLRDALALKLRWSDHAYLGRIVFEQMLSASSDWSRANRLGFGISASCGDGRDRILALDVSAQKVARIEEPLNGPQRTHRLWSFEQFCMLSDAECRRVWCTNNDPLHRQQRALSILRVFRNDLNRPLTAFWDLHESLDDCNTGHCQCDPKELMWTLESLECAGFVRFYSSDVSGLPPEQARHCSDVADGRGISHVELVDPDQAHLLPLVSPTTRVVRIP